MTAVDYEVEYNNRARVPEHPQIFERYARDAAAYREARQGQATIGIQYGPSPRRTLDLFPPLTESADKPPLALFIHGGWWRSLDPRMFSHMARGANAHGVNVAVAGYDLCPACSISDIVEQMRTACLTLWRRFNQRITVFGHSAGGHLAACMLATDWKTISPEVPEDLILSAYAISGVFDLRPLATISVNTDLKLTPQEAERMSPLFWDVDAGRCLDAVVGALESNEFLRQSKTIAEAWRQDEVDTRYEEIAGTNHFTVIEPLADPEHAMTRRVVELARETEAARISL
jgi:arylformamidase